MDASTGLQILLVPLLVAANAFFVAAEYALMVAPRVPPHDDRVTEDDDARRVEHAQRDLARSMSGAQLGITVSSLGLGWIVGSGAVGPLGDLFLFLGAPWASVAVHAVAVAVAFTAVVFLHVLLGEMLPRSAALQRPEAVARALSRPLGLFTTVTAPFLWLLDRAARRLVPREHRSGLGLHTLPHRAGGLALLLQEGRAERVLEEDEEEMIHGVFELTRTVAREVMTPRPDIIAISESATLDEVLETAATSGFSRFPVYRESIDDIIGLILVKDLLPWLQRSDRSEFDPTRLMREPFFVPDSKPVDDLLAEFRKQKVHLAVVVDEFGGTDGVVTLEDLVEEIVGDIYDEHDVAQEEIVLLGAGKARVDGATDPGDLVERFRLGFVEDADEYDTVAGWVIGQLGRIPDEGECIRLGMGELQVLETQEQRLTLLELRFPDRSERAGRDGG